MYDEHAWTFFFTHPTKKNVILIAKHVHRTCLAIFFKFFYFFFEKNTHACSSDMGVILPYTGVGGGLGVRKSLQVDIAKRYSRFLSTSSRNFEFLLRG